MKKNIFVLFLGLIFTTATALVQASMPEKSTLDDKIQAIACMDSTAQVEALITILEAMKANKTGNFQIVSKDHISSCK